MEIFTLLKANIRNKKGNFISTLVLIFILSLVLTTVIGVVTNSDRRLEEAYQEVNMPDSMSAVKEDDYTEDIAETIRECEGVDSVEVLKALYSTGVFIDGERADRILFLDYDNKEHRYNQYSEDLDKFLKENRTPEKGEILLPVSFVQHYGCAVGDMVHIEVKGKEQEFKIAGFIEEPFAGAFIMGIKNALMNSQDFKELYEERLHSEDIAEGAEKGIILYQCIYIHAQEEWKDDIYQLRKNIDDVSGFMSAADVALTIGESRTYTMLLNHILAGILVLFSVLLFIVVLVIMGHSVVSTIEMEYVSFGVLKSQGFTKWKLRLILILQYVLSGVTGIVFGTAASIPATGFLIGIFTPISGVLASRKLNLGISIPLLMFVLALACFYVLLKTKKLASISPVRAISGGRDSIYFSARMQMPVTGKTKRSFKSRLALRQLTSNAKQYIGIGIISCILTFFMIAVTAFGQMANVDWLYRLFGWINADIIVDYGNYPELQKEIEEVIADRGGIEEYENKNQYYFLIDGYNFAGRVDGRAQRLDTIIDGRIPIYENEIVVTELVSDILGKGIGDEVTIGYGEEEADYLIVGTYQCVNDVGKIFCMNTEGMKRLQPDYEYNIYDYVLSDSSTVKDIVSELEEKYASYVGEITFTDNSEKETAPMLVVVIAAIEAIFYIIYVISIAVIAVSSIMVSGRTFLKERKDIGIYKAGGFTTSMLRIQFALRFVFVSLIGAAVGICLNLWLNDPMMVAVLKQMGISVFRTKYNLMTIAVPVSIVVAVFFLFSYMVAGKIKKVSTRELIVE